MVKELRLAKNLTRLFTAYFLCAVWVDASQVTQSITANIEVVETQSFISQNMSAVYTVYEVDIINAQNGQDFSVDLGVFCVYNNNPSGMILSVLPSSAEFSCSDGSLCFYNYPNNSKYSVILKFKGNLDSQYLELDPLANSGKKCLDHYHKGVDLVSCVSSAIEVKMIISAEDVRSIAPGEYEIALDLEALPHSEMIC